MNTDSIPQPTDSVSTEQLNQRFFAHLWRGGAYSYWWFADPSGRKWSQWFAANAVSKITPGVNVYFGINPVAEIPSKNSQGVPTSPAYVRSRNDLIVAVNCLYAEFDAKDFDGGLPECAAHIEQLNPAPSVIIFSGGGYHAYWLLDDPYKLKSPAKQKRARRIQRDWVAYVQGDLGARDIARPLRVPGTKNLKPKYGPDFPTVQYVKTDFSAVFDIDDLEDVAAETLAQRAATQPRVNAGNATNSQPGEFHDSYVLAAVNGELDTLARALEGGRNDQLNKSAFALGTLVGAGVLDEATAIEKLSLVAVAGGQDERAARATINSGLMSGKQYPRKLPERNAAGGGGGRAGGGGQGPTFNEQLAQRREYVFSDDFYDMMRALFEKPVSFERNGRTIEFMQYRSGETDRRVYNALLSIASLRSALRWSYVAGLSQIRDMAGVGSKTTVRAAIERLIGAGLVEIVTDPDSELSAATRYKLNDPLLKWTGGKDTTPMDSNTVHFSNGSDAYSDRIATDPFLMGRSRFAKVEGLEEKGLGAVMLVCIASIEASGASERSELVARTGATRSAVARATRRAEDLGLLSSERGRRGAKIYSLPEVDVWESVETLTPYLKTYKLRVERLERDAQAAQFWLERQVADFSRTFDDRQKSELRLAKIKARRNGNLRIIHPDWTEAAIAMWVNAPMPRSRWHMVARLDAQERDMALSDAVGDLTRQGIDRGEWAYMLGYAGFDAQSVVRALGM